MATVPVDVVQIDTTPSIKSVKDLRDHIKNLKDQLVQLDEGTDEYNQTARECGEAIHQLQVITETTRGFTSDFGDVLGNISKTTAGLVGGINAISSAIKIFGGESELAQEAMLKLQQSMAIVQGLSAIDAGIKSFKKLIPVIKSATTAMKAFAMSNPFTAIIAGATALAGIVYGIAKSFNDGAKEAEAFGRSLELSLKQLDDAKKLQSWQLEYAEACGATTEEIVAMTRAQLESNRAAAEALTIEAQRGMTNAKNHKEFEKYQEAYRTAMDAWRKASDAQLDFEMKTLVDEARARKQARQQQIAAAKKAAQDRIKIADDEYNHKKTLLDQEHELTMLNIDPKDVKATYEANKKYYESLLKLQEDYLIRVGKRKKTADYDPTKDIDTINTAIINTQKSLTKLTADYQAYNAEQEKIAAQALINQKISEQNIETNKQTTELQHQHNQALLAGTTAEAELIKMEKERLELQLQQYDGQESALKMKLDADLISQIEYFEAVANIENERLLLQDQIAQKSVDITKAEIKAKKEEIEKLTNSYIQVGESIGDMLGGIADNFDQNSEEYKALMIAQTIISMLSGSVKAISGAMELGPVFGPVVGATQSAAIIASGIATINKMRQVSNTNTNVSASATQIAAATPTTQTYINNEVVQTKQARDQRVYVLESDITNVQKSNRVVVGESTF